MVGPHPKSLPRKEGPQRPEKEARAKGGTSHWPSRNRRTTPRAESHSTFKCEESRGEGDGAEGLLRRVVEEVTTRGEVHDLPALAPGLPTRAAAPDDCGEAGNLSGHPQRRGLQIGGQLRARVPGSPRQERLRPHSTTPSQVRAMAEGLWKGPRPQQTGKRHDGARLRKYRRLHGRRRGRSKSPWRQSSSSLGWFGCCGRSRSVPCKPPTSRWSRATIVVARRLTSTESFE